MNKKLFILLVLLCGSCLKLLAQEFQTSLIIKDRFGVLDTVEIGFDQQATFGIDEMFGEDDIGGIPLENTLDVRLGYLNFNMVECLDGTVDDLGEVLVQSKKAIIPINCNDQDLYREYISLFVEESRYPITVYWAKEDFQTDCLFRSFMSPNFVAGWFDAYCGSPTCQPTPQSYYAELFLRDSVYYECPSGLRYINQFSDTLNSLTISLSAQFSSSLAEIESADINIFPNPVEGITRLVFTDYLPEEAFIVLYDASGKKVFSTRVYQESSIDLSELHAGVYVYEIVDGDELLLSGKIVKI